MCDERAGLSSWLIEHRMLVPFDVYLLPLSTGVLAYRLLLWTRSFTASKPPIQKRHTQAQGRHP